jgi:hypothetical protein
MKSKNKSASKISVKDFDFDQYLNMKKAERVKLLQQMVENLDVESRKKFFKGLLPYVLSDDDLTREAFKNNTGKQKAKPSRVVELTTREKAMIGQIADYFQELQYIVDLDELMFNP